MHSGSPPPLSTTPHGKLFIFSFAAAPGAGQVLFSSCHNMFETGGVSFNVEKKRRRIQKQQGNGRLRKKNL
jgi:hypothetical protein